MIRLRARAEICSLQLDEVADMHLVAEYSARAHPGKRADVAALADRAAGQVAEPKDLGPRSHADLRPQHDIGPDRHIGRQFGVHAKKH